MESRILLIFIICLFTINTCSSSVEILPVKEAEKVQVKVYYESLCPYCENFIVNYLIDVFIEGIDAIADVKLFPYGNAKVNANGNITCQHGENECFLNTVEACAINTWPDVHDHFPFIYCVERYLYYDKFDKWESCFEELSLDPKPVKDCYTSGMGNQLELQYADVTNSLQPPKKYVPWVVVDGKPLYDHGEWECVLNTVEACAIHAWPVVSDHFPFVYCVEKLTYEGKYAEWETCFEKLKLDPKPVTDCISNGFGQELELQYAAEIKVLEPPHTYVPWVTVDGQPLYDDYTEFTSFICEAYKGSNVPQVCLSLSHPPKNTVKPLNDVCYKEDNEKSKSTLMEMISATAASWMRHLGMAESM